MIDHVSPQRLSADPAELSALYDREPFGFTHSLHESGLFKLDVLRELAERHTADDYFVAASAPTPGTRFYDVPHSMLHPRAALDDIEHHDYRIILKRPERYDARFRDLRDGVIAEVKALRGWPAGERIERADASILFNSTAAITPLHYDPEVSFFFQIAGQKSYHLLDPRSMSEAELERFYVRGRLDIAQVAFAGREDAREWVFELGPGLGMHQPQNTPHWVKTLDRMSISYVVSIETSTSRALGRTRAFNALQRRVGLTPAAPGHSPSADAVKSEVMRAAFGARDRVAPVVRRLRRGLRG